MMAPEARIGRRAGTPRSPARRPLCPMTVLCSNATRSCAISSLAANSSDAVEGSSRWSSVDASQEVGLFLHAGEMDGCLSPVHTSVTLDATSAMLMAGAIFKQRRWRPDGYPPWTSAGNRYAALRFGKAGRLSSRGPRRGRCRGHSSALAPRFCRGVAPRRWTRARAASPCQAAARPAHAQRGLSRHGTAPTTILCMTGTVEHDCPSGAPVGAWCPPSSRSCGWPQLLVGGRWPSRLAHPRQRHTPWSRAKCRHTGHSSI
jgi:hypothetical protein